MKGGSQEQASGREAIAVGLGDLLDDAVCTKKPDLPARLGGEASPVSGLEGRRRAVDLATDVAVSEAGRCEVPAGDGGEQCEVGWIAEAERAEAAIVLDDRARDGVEEFGAGRGVFDGGEGLEVRLVGALG